MARTLVARERLSEQRDVTFILDPASAEAGYHVCASYTDHGNPGEGETLHVDLANDEFLRISGYGAWASRAFPPPCVQPLVADAGGQGPRVRSARACYHPATIRM
ncbi:hypothetical protein [Streptomyces sp. NPDC097610]|uniref:hypothetical protein n=1 Tax=Streptomyces sp. NPDC097610 TaxID=3157227 RepID=UPI00331B820B